MSARFAALHAAGTFGLVNVHDPGSVDAENGWGTRPDDVADTIRLLAEVGAAGASIEDWSSDPTVGFYNRDEAVERHSGILLSGSG